MTLLSGGCQCGAVRYRIEGELSNPHICHCRMCQKAAGNFSLALAAQKRENVQVTRGSPGWFQSSAIVKRGFCANCGTPLFFDPLDTGYMLVTLGSLDDPSRYKPVSEDSVESRVPFVAEWAGLRQKVTSEDFTPAQLDLIRASSHQHPDHDTAEWPIGEKS